MRGSATISVHANTRTVEKTMQAHTLGPDEDMTLLSPSQALRFAALELRTQTLEREKSELLARITGMEAELAMHRQNKKNWDWVFVHSRDLLLVHDNGGRVLSVSPSVTNILGHTPAEFAELGVYGIVHPDDLDGTLRHLAGIENDTDVIKYVTRNRHKNGQWRWIEWTRTPPGKGDEALIPAYAVGRDVTDSKLTEQELLRRARQDALTGLANRAAFDQALSEILARSERSGRSAGMLLIDLDGFKAINDTHGHCVGDAVLKAVAGRIDVARRKGDVVARLGGDEFACLMQDADRASLETVAARMLDSVLQPIQLGPLQVELGCSIGIAWADATTDAATLYDQADKAMYQAKAGGKRGYRCHGA
jgi:diguanylate cyclase (GGDEF)-like protein/PAS domain S-box-containing protein